MKQNAEPNTQPKREGIALIMVLGFLSILILMVIAFLTNMRTERLVAETAKDDVRVRHLTHSALAVAMDDVNYILRNYTNGTTNWATGPRPVNIRVTPNWAIIVSTNFPPYTSTNLGPNVRLISGEVTNWLPRKYLSSQDVNYNATSKAAQANWVWIHDPNPRPGQQTNILGRYAYLVFDCTGMMDANLFTNSVQRDKGISVSEISIAYLPDVEGYSYKDKINSEDDFTANKANYSRFGTFPEILFLNDGVPNDREASALSIPDVNNLMPYSLCYDAGWWDWSVTNWSVSFSNAPIDINEWIGNPTNAYNAFRGVGFTATQASNMAVCYQDYVDGDSLPGVSGSETPKPDILCCETIPMINEIILTNQLSESGGFLTHKVYIDVELWYPFLGFTNNAIYTVDVSGWFRCDIVGLKPPPFANLPAINNYEFSENEPFGVLRCPLPPIPPVTNSLSATNMSLSLLLKNVRVLLSGTPTVVDSCTVLEGKPIRITVPLPAANSTICSNNGISVLDPRLNHLTNSWGLAPITYGTTNIVPGMMGLSANGDHEGTVMYVRNGPMQSVAELGFIPRGSPWTTIDLFSQQGRDLLAKFRTTNIVAGEKIYTNGLINPNTLFTNVLVAAFLDAPIEAYPGGTSSVLNAAMASSIVGPIYEISSNAAASAFDSPAGWVTTRAFAVQEILSTIGLDNNQKESIIRNSYRLFNPNQNLFTIVVIAQAINDNNDQGTIGVWDGENTDTIAGEKRAVALVWRDPFPDPATGRHEMFVRTFKYLDE